MEIQEICQSQNRSRETWQKQNHMTFNLKPKYWFWSTLRRGIHDIYRNEELHLMVTLCWIKLLARMPGSSVFKMLSWSWSFILGKVYVPVWQLKCVPRWWERQVQLNIISIVKTSTSMGAWNALVVIILSPPHHPVQSWKVRFKSFECLFKGRYQRNVEVHVIKTCS